MFGGRKPTKDNASLPSGVRIAKTTSSALNKLAVSDARFDMRTYSRTITPCA